MQSEDQTTSWEVIHREWVEKMDTFLQTSTNSVGTQLCGMNSNIEKMKEEGKEISEIIANMEKKFSMKDEANEIKTDDSNKVHEDQNHGRTVATGFHGDTF